MLSRAAHNAEKQVKYDQGHPDRLPTAEKFSDHHL